MHHYAKMCVRWRDRKGRGKGLPAGIMDDFFYDTPNVTIALCVVECAEFGRCLVVVGVRLELKCK